MNRSLPALLWLYDILQVQVAAIRDINDLYLDDRLQDQETLKFSVQANHPMVQYIQPDRLIQYDGRIYIVTTLVQARTKGDVTIKVEAEARWVELSRRTKAGLTTVLSKTNVQGLTTILSGSGWTVGSVVADAGLYSIDELDATVTALVRRWASITGTEVIWDTVNKTVSLVASQGSSLGVGFRYGHNVQTITRRYEPPVVTRLYPYGANDLTIATVNPTSLEYIEDYSWYTAQGLTLLEAQARYRKDQIWSDDRYLLALNLYDAAVARLALLAQPIIAYEMDVLDLYTLTGSGSPVAIGDTVTVRDDEFDIDLQTRVVRVERYPNAPWKDKVELQYLQRTLSDSDLAVSVRTVDASSFNLLVATNELALTVAGTALSLGTINITVAGEGSFAAGATFKGTATGSGNVEFALYIDGIAQVPVFTFAFVAGQVEFSWPTFATGIAEGSHDIEWRARVTSGAGTIAVAIRESREWILIKGAVGVGVNNSPSQSVIETLTLLAGLTLSDTALVEMISPLDIVESESFTMLVSTVDDSPPSANVDIEPQVTPRAVGAAVYVAGANIVTTAPAGTAADDYLTLAVRSTLALTTPAGWTLLSTASVAGDTRAVYGRKADGTATDTPTFTGAHVGGAQMTGWLNVDTATPTAGAATPNTHAASAAAKTGPTVTPTASGLVVNIEIRAAGGVSTAQTGGTLVAGTNVSGASLVAPVVTNDAIIGITTTAASYTPTSSSDSSTHAIVLSRA